MIEIKAKLVTDRISLARAGSRNRRLPTIVLGTGAVIKLSPGRSVKVTEAVYEANKALLSQFDGMLEVSGYSAPVVVEEPAPVVVEEPAPVVVEEPAPVVVEELAPVVVEEPAPVVVEELAPVVVEEPAPKKKRRRRTKAEIAADRRAKASKNG